MPLHAVRPKILGFISEQVSAWLVAVVVFLTGIALTVIVAWTASDLYQQQLRQRFQLLVNERYSRLHNVSRTRSNAWAACGGSSSIPIQSPAQSSTVSRSLCCCVPAPMLGRPGCCVTNAVRLSKR